jgi:acyl-CoA synthetase (AMP-forming)/AMP-acid ligase II
MIIIATRDADWHPAPDIILVCACEERKGDQRMLNLYRASTVGTLLEAGNMDAPGIGAPDRSPLTHGGLRDLCNRTVQALNRMGIGRNDRVAIVLPNGPEMAACFIAIACGATTAPLNPAYRGEEFDFYLSDLNAKALVVQKNMESPALAVARARGIPIVQLVPGARAGEFELESDITGIPAKSGFAEEGDIALVLHTSGTTSRPKIVPLSHINVTASAYHIGNTLALREDDVCLNIMPLFHIHGLIAATLSSIAAGASVVCTPGFNALKFFSWFEEARPSWYTAVPTMHQAILMRADRNKDIVAKGRLRLVRSSSSSLPPQVMEALETTFGVPVIESYGMTEAAHQMASNPLPPHPRFAGCVGIAAGPDVAIMDEGGELLPAGALGEIVIRGRNVTAGYEANPDANAKAFANGWFRTGDQGVLDDAGYLRLTGRLKELINRGGEKISPLEIDTIIMDHPAVAQVVTFGVPHDKLGEDIAAAVVLREGTVCDERELRAFVGSRVADFKVPRKIIFLEEIPKGATGKLQRIGLHEKLADELGMPG